LKEAVSISIIVPSYGRAEVLAECVEGLLAQSRQPEEILVVHQQPEPSSPGTRRLKAWSEGGRIRLFETGFANAQRARNLGIREARSDVVLLLDDDVFPAPDLVERHVQNYKNDPSLDGVAGQVLEKGQLPTFDVSPQFFRPHVGWQFSPLNYGLRMPAINWPSTNSSARRKVAIAAGGFDEQFERTWLDDTDFSVRLLRCGARLVFDPTARVVHRKVASGGKRLPSHPSLWMDCLGWMTHFYFWRKNFGLWKARYPLCWNLRYLVFRKAVLIRPSWLVRNLAHLFRGYRLATRKLREGPRYLRDRETG
jgi:GT2 family glycosyltransferase